MQQLNLDQTQIVSGGSSDNMKTAIKAGLVGGAVTALYVCKTAQFGYLSIFAIPSMLIGGAIVGGVVAGYAHNAIESFANKESIDIDTQLI